MKKFFTLAAAFMATAVSFQATAGHWVVKDKAEFTSAWGGLGNTIGSRDTIVIAPETEGEIINVGSIKMKKAGKIWLIGATDDIDNLSGLAVGFDGEKQTLEGLDEEQQKNDYGTEIGSDLSVYFENLSLHFRNGVTATSGHIFYFKQMYADMDSVVFRHCEICDSPRGLYRLEPKSYMDGDTKVYYPGGSINYFEISDSKIHNIFATEGNGWSLIYPGQKVYEVLLKNNTFYDMPYIQSIFRMGYFTNAEDLASGLFNVYNNTIMLHSGRDCNYFWLDGFVGADTKVNLYNNFILTPDWDDDLNLTSTNTNVSKIVKMTMGMVTAQSNVIEGHAPWSAGNNKDEETGDPSWIVADTTDNYTLAALEMTMDNFYDRNNKDFSLLKSDKSYTSGVKLDEYHEVVVGEKSYIGDGRWYLDQFPTKAAVNVAINGSTTATLKIEPEKAIYFVGDEITLTLDLHDGLNTFTGWSDGSTELTRTVTLTGDLNLTANVVSANYEMLWDFCQLKDGNNKTLTLPLAANHAASAENPGTFGIMTVEHSADKATYADTTSCQTRNNKAYIYNGSKEPVLFMAALLRTRLDSVVVEQEEKATGYKGELTNACCKNPDYYYIKFSTKGMTGVKVASVILAEARMHKTTKVEYSLDNKTYNTLTTVTIDSVGDAWRDANITLPAAAENQDAVYVRWIGDTESPIVGPGMAGTDKDGNGYPVSRKYYTYQFIGNIKVTAETGGAAIEELEAEAGAALVVAQNGNQVTVSNAEAATVELYAANGALVASQAVIDGTATITLPAHGVYYIKAGKDAKAVVY